MPLHTLHIKRSNNTNKHSPQEHTCNLVRVVLGSNNTNKHSPQERVTFGFVANFVQIIQINIVLKNSTGINGDFESVQIIQINIVLKNTRI